MASRAKTIRVEGRVYRFVGGNTRKTEATKHAKRIRARGEHARVVKDQLGYAVYAHGA